LYLPHLTAIFQHSLNAGAAKKTLFQRPSFAMRALTDPERVKRRLDSFFDHLRHVDGQPWSVVAPATASFTSLLHEVQTRSRTPMRFWAVYVFQPTHLVFDRLISELIPDCQKAMEQEYVSRSSTRGMGVAYAIAAFHHERQYWPATLAEAETWANASFPVDVFTSAPYQYAVSASGTPSLVSPGLDLLYGTTDDLIYLLFPTVIASRSPDITHTEDTPSSTSLGRRKR